jgi:hypothetical protein
MMEDEAIVWRSLEMAERHFAKAWRTLNGGEKIIARLESGNGFC